MKRLASLLAAGVLPIALGSLAATVPAQSATPTTTQPRPVVVVPYYVNPYYTSPYYGYPYRYPYGHPYYYGPTYYPPVFVSPDTLYGPRPIQQLMGVEHWFRPNTGSSSSVSRPVVPRAAPAQPAPARAAPAAKPANPRAPNEGAVTLAWKYIGYGDANFAGAKYADASERYRKAAQTAPLLAEAWFRQGFAQAGLGRYDLAVAAIRRGLELKPDWVKSNFRMSELFGGNEQAKLAHVETIVKAAQDKPQDADLAVIAGIYLYFDGQREKAAPYFEKAAQLAVGGKAFLGGFLAKEPPAAALNGNPVEF